MPHIDTATVLDALEGRLHADRMDRVGQHVAACGACAAEFDRFGELLSALAAPALNSAPDRVVQRAFGIFEATRAKPLSVLEAIGNLLFDSWALPVVAGLRGHSNSRQLAFAAGDFDVHIGLDGDRDQTTIRGQLLARGDLAFIDTFSVMLVNELDAELIATSANEFGEFHFPLLPAGCAAIVIRIPGTQTIRCPLPEGATRQQPHGDQSKSNASHGTSK